MPEYFTDISISATNKKFKDMNDGKVAPEICKFLKV
jgi:hypothetical protein